MAKSRNNGSRIRAPKGGVRIGGRYFKAGDMLPEKYGRMVPPGEHSRDPASGIPLAPPNYGRFSLPHAITFVGKQMTISHVYSNPDEAIRNAGGQAWKMRRDPVVMAPLEARQRASALLNWHLEVENEKDPKQKELQTELTKIIKRTYQFTEYRRCLMEALWYGRYAVEHKFGFQMVDDKRRCVVKDWRPINGDKLVFRFDDGTGKYSDDDVGVRVTPIYGQQDALAGRRELEITPLGMAYFLEPWERSLFCIHRHIIEDGDYEDVISAGRVHGVGIRDRIWWCWFQKQETMAQIMEVINRTGSGITIYWYPAGDDAAKQETLELAEKQRHDNVLVMPRMSADPASDAYGIERIEPTATGIEILKGVIHEFFGHQIVRYIAGQTLSSESSAMGIGSGAADFQSETWGMIVKYDAIKQEETITSELINRALKPYNFPWAADIPVWFRIDTQSSESHKKLEGIKSAWDMGARIKASDVMDVIGLAMPGEDDETLTNPAIAQQLRLAAQQFGEQQGAGDELHQLFGPLADLVGDGQQQPGMEQGGPEMAQQGGEQPPAGEAPAGPPGPAQYAKKSAAGQASFLWKEELHPRDEGGQFEEKGGGSGLPVPPLKFDEVHAKLKETENYPDSPTAMAVRHALLHKIGTSDIHPEQLQALLSADDSKIEALRQHAMQTGRHHPGGEEPFALQQQAVKQPDAPDKPVQPTGGRQEAFWHGMGDKPGQEKLFEGMDLAGGQEAPETPPDEPAAEEPAESPEPPAVDEAGQRDAELAKAAQAGDMKAREKLLAQYTPMVHFLAHRIAKKRDDYDELAQVGQIAVNDSITKFDPTKARAGGMKGYAWRAILNALARAQQKARRGGEQFPQGEEGEDYEVPGKNRFPSPQAAASRKEEKAWLNKALDKLPERSGRILRGRLDGETFEAIASELGITKQRAQKIYADAQEKLKGMRGQKEFKALNYKKDPSHLYRRYVRERLW